VSTKTYMLHCTVLFFFISLFLLYHWGCVKLLQALFQKSFENPGSLYVHLRNNVIGFMLDTIDMVFFSYCFCNLLFFVFICTLIHIFFRLFNYFSSTDIWTSGAHALVDIWFLVPHRGKLQE
jgi:hypothetical protein